MAGFRNILCMLAPEEANRPTLERAVSLALSNQARLTVVDVIAPLPAGLRLPGANLARATLETGIAAERLQALKAFTAAEAARVEIHDEVLVGTPFIEVIGKILRDGHDLLIKPAMSPGLAARLFGSGDMHLLRKCPCPVWITRGGEPRTYRSILAAIDFDADAPGADPGLNRQILHLASWLSAADGATLHVAHAWDAPGEATVRAWANSPAAAEGYVEGERARHQAALDSIGGKLRKQLGDEAWSFLAPRFYLRQGLPAEIIPKLAEDLQVDLVVMGTIARTGISGLIIGNTAENILEQLGCAVLAVKPDGFVSPVLASGSDR